MYTYDTPDPQTPREQYHAAGHWLRLLDQNYENALLYEMANHPQEASDCLSHASVCLAKLDQMPRRYVSAARCAFAWERRKRIHHATMRIDRERRRRKYAL